MSIGTEESGNESLTSETAYSILTDSRRRYLVHYLKQRDDPATVRELSEQVAAWENDKPISELDSQERKRVYVSLRQGHLDTLEDQNVVRYDEQADEVALTEAARDLDIHLEVVGQRDIPWQKFYVGLAGINAVVLALVWLELYPFSVVPDLAWAGIVLLQFGLSALVGAYRSRPMHIGDAGPPPDVNDE